MFKNPNKIKIILAAVIFIFTGIYWGATHGGDDPGMYINLKPFEDYRSYHYISWSAFRYWAIKILVGDDIAIMNVDFGFENKCGNNPGFYIEEPLSNAIFKNVGEYSPNLCLGIRKHPRPNEAKLAPGERKT